MVSKQKRNNGYRAPAVHKAFQLLRLVAETPDAMGITRLSAALGFSKSTTHGLVHALIGEGALNWTRGGKRVCIGPGIVALGFSAWNYLKIAEEVQPVINRLRDKIGETVFLGAWSRSRVLIMATSEAADSLKISAPPGTSLPLLAGAVGKAFLASLPGDEASQLIKTLGLQAHTPLSIVSETDYAVELERVRLKGYASDNEEYLPGVKAVAVPIENRQGLPMAVWVVGLAGALTSEKIDAMVPAIQRTALELRATLPGGD